MKEMRFEQMNQLIDQKKSEVERTIMRDREEGRVLRTRPRDPDEVKILDQIAILKWKKAEAEGKIK